MSGSTPRQGQSDKLPELFALDVAPEGQMLVGEMLAVVVVYAANVVQDLRENLRNLVGGRMTHYEQLIQSAIDAGMVDLQRKAAERGYDGVVGVKLSNPQVVDGGVEVVIYGNGFHRTTQ